MPRGGYRVGAGGRFKWIHGKTKLIRVPEVLADEIVRIAIMVDNGKVIDDVTQSKHLNLSGVRIHFLKDGPVVYLEDLLKAGFTIRPVALVDRVRELLDRRKV
jgi:hypothetical protein